MAHNKTRNTFWWDTIEQVETESKQIVKDVATSVVDVFNPLSTHEKKSNNPEEAMQNNKNAEIQKMQQEVQKKGDSHTPLNFDQLGEKYRKQDDVHLKALQQRFHQNVVTGTERAIMEIKKEEEEKKRQEAYEEEEKKRQEQEANMHPQEEAQGKQKGKLGQARRKAHVPDPAEMKPGGSKH